MNFYNWPTDYQLYKRQTDKKSRDAYPVFYRKRIQQLREAGIIPVRLWTEDQWQKIGNPYYNVHPKMAPKLCRVDLTKIPSTMLKMPHDFPVVNIRFTQQHNEFTVLDEMVADNAMGTMPPGSFCHSLLMFDNREKLQPLLPQMVFFVMDFNVFTKYNQTVYTVLGILPEEGQSLEAAMNDQRKDRYSDSYDTMLQNVMRLAVTIGFLANNPAICESDVLSRDRDEFRHTSDEDRRQTIIARARRKGKLGYNIGNDMMFLGERPVSARRQSEAATRRELEWAHIRSGHPHAVRHGPGKKQVKIMWFQPTTVRDDLPFKSE